MVLTLLYFSIFFVFPFCTSWIMRDYVSCFSWFASCCVMLLPRFISSVLSIGDWRVFTWVRNGGEVIVLWQVRICATVWFDSERMEGFSLHGAALVVFLHMGRGIGPETLLPVSSSWWPLQASRVRTVAWIFTYFYNCWPLLDGFAPGRFLELWYWYWYLGPSVCIYWMQFTSYSQGSKLRCDWSFL